MKFNVRELVFKTLSSEQEGSTRRLVYILRNGIGVLEENDKPIVRGYVHGEPGISYPLGMTRMRDKKIFTTSRISNIISDERKYYTPEQIARFIAEQGL